MGATPIPKAAANISERSCLVSTIGQATLIHVGQVGTGFDQKMLKEIFDRLQPLKTKQNPFYGEIGGLRKVQFVRPELVAEIKFAEWTHEKAEGGMKLRAPVFMGLRAENRRRNAGWKKRLQAKNAHHALQNLEITAEERSIRAGRGLAGLFSGR